MVAEIEDDIEYLNYNCTN